MVLAGKPLRFGFRLWIALLVLGLCSTVANAAVTLLGVQYQEDDPLTEYNCLWKPKYYPTSCIVASVGANLHVFFKNEGATSVTLNDVNFVGYSLKTVLKQQDLNGHITNSIWFYWDNPPATILDAGEPAWYRMDPNTIPPGGVGQVIVRLRRIPTVASIAVNVQTSANTLSTNIAVANTVPLLANVSYSQDLKTVYMYWRRAGGAAPSTILMNGIDITADCVTVNDPNTNFAATVYTRSSALTELSYNVFQGIYSNGETATGGLRVWRNPFIYGSWGAFEVAEGDYATARAWMDTCEDRGINTLEMNSSSSGLMNYFGTSGGQTYANSRNYGFIKDNNGWGTWGENPRLWFIDDEPDAEETTVLANFCGTGNKLPCGSNQAATMGMHFIARGEELRAIKNRPTTINMDGAWKPYSWYGYGQLTDCLAIDSYYQARLRDSYYWYPNEMPLYTKATVIYATSLAGTKAAEPNPFRILLDSCQRNKTVDGVATSWPFAPPETKRTEVYYALAGGAKGICYWWFKYAPSASNGLGGNNTNLVPQNPALWKEIGLLGAEIKTLQPYLVTSHQADLNVLGSNNVWVRGLTRGTDTLFIIAINDNHYNDQAWHGTDTPNATITVTLPAWMQPSAATAFEVNRQGLKNVTTSLNSNQVQLSIGTLSVARLFVVTTDPMLRMAIQNRYDTVSWPGICRFASDVGYANNSPPAIVAHPSNASVLDGDSAVFAVTANGGSPFSFQWQKNGSNLTNGGHYSGCTTFALTVSSANSGDEGSYRCVVTTPYGSATSNAATLSMSAPTPPSITQHPSNQVVDQGSSAAFTIAATGSNPLTYQWQKNNANVTNGGHYSGCTTPTLAIANVDGNDPANYRCVVTNPYGSATSNAASLTLAPPGPPTVTEHPSNQSVMAGGTAVFSVTATGTAPLSYQWQKNQANLTNGGHYAGCTTASLTVSNADSGDTANYRCVVANTYGNATSNEASLSIAACSAVVVNGGFEGGNTNGVGTGWTGYTRPTVPSFVAYTIQAASPPEGLQYQQIQSSYVASGGAGVYQVVTGCVSGATYRVQGSFRTNSTSGRATVKVAPNGSTSYGSAIDLAPAASTTSSTWSAFNGTVTATAPSITIFLDGQTHVSVTGDGKAAAFDNITITCDSIGSAPTVSQHPGAQSVCPGGTAIFAVAATGDGTLAYQWQKNSANVTNGGHYSGCTTATLTVSNADNGDAAGYRCVVSNGFGSTSSNAANLTLKPTTAIGQHPQAQSIAAGATAGFTVAATGDGALAYQWQKNSVNITNGGHYSGCTTATLTISNADSGDAANYRCVVTGGCGSAVSNQAALMVGASVVPGDFDSDGDIDLDDFAVLQECLAGSDVEVTDPACIQADLNADGFVDRIDVSQFIGCVSGPMIPANPACVAP